jgi:hypothetical protein
MTKTKVRRSLLALIYVVCTMSGCSIDPSGGPMAERLRTPEGFTTWKQDEERLQQRMQAVADQYRQDNAIGTLREYDLATRAYLDNGFILYRAYQTVNRSPPLDLVPSLDQRLARLMDVADEYIKQGSTTMAVGIAADVVQNYSDLPMMASAQRRAEAILLRYRYRRDY